MLPSELCGPGTVIYFEEDPEFVVRNSARYPFLDPDFISQICYEHSRRFNELYPGFDIDRHAAVRISKTAGWIRDHVRYVGNRELEPFWSFQVDSYPTKGTGNLPVLKHMVENRTWPFPPVVVDASLAAALGRGPDSPYELGRPYELVEGTHRTSYLLRFLSTGRIQATSLHEVIEIVERGRSRGPTI